LRSDTNHEPKRRKTKTGNNQTLDQAVGCMRWLGGCDPLENTLAEKL